MKKFILIAGICASLSYAQNAPLPTQIPNFNLPDLKGIGHTQTEFANKPVLVDFWATWCLSCIHTIPFIKKMNEQYGPQGLQVIGISIDKKSDKLVKFTEKNGMNYLQLWDKESSLAKVLDFTAVPSLFLFDASGKLVLAIKGYDEKGESEILKAIQNIYPDSVK